MKRVLTILMLLSGSLIAAVTVAPGQAWAGDPVEQYLEVPDFRDEILLDTDGRPGDGPIPPDEGDPDGLGGGYGVDEQDNLQEILSGFADLPDGMTLEDLWMFLLTEIWAAP